MRKGINEETIGASNVCKQTSLNLAGERREVRECQKKCIFEYTEYWPLRGIFQNNYQCLKQRNAENLGVFNHAGPGSYLDREISNREKR